LKELAFPNVILATALDAYFIRHVQCLWLTRCLLTYA